MFRNLSLMIGLIFIGSLSLQAQDKFTTFSFASDDTHDSPVFFFSNGSLFEAKATVDLMVDVNDNNQGGQVTFQSTFAFRGEAYDYNRIPCGSGWLHIWKVKASANFVHLDPTMGNVLLEIEFREAALTSYSPSASRVGQTLTLQVSEGADPSLQIVPQTIMIGAGVDIWELVEREDLAFTFTKARDRNFNQFIPLNNNGQWLFDFNTESSFSASGSPN